MPFAIIGVLLLLTSVTFVGHTLTRSTVTPNVDASVAISQTEGVTQSAIRTGAQHGIETAASQPLTETSDTRWGAVLNASDPDTARESPDKLVDESLASGTFRNYLRAMIYLEVRSSLERAGQRVGDVRTNVSVPNVGSPAALRAAIDRVSLGEPAEGVLEVTIENVTITARSEGRVIDDRETAISVSIATPIMQLHQRVERFERALDAGVTERGFSQRFNARIYALGWARGYAQNYQAPIAQVLANRHIEPAANDAVYRTQKDVFGAADPELQDANRLGWTCMALKDGGAMFDEYMGSNDVSYRNSTYTGDELVFDRSNGSDLSASVPTDGKGVADTLCSGAELALGDQVTGELPEAPGTRDLLGDAPGMNATDTIGVNQTAYVPLARMASADSTHSIDSAIDRIYTIDGRAHTRSTVVDPLALSGSATCNNSAHADGTYTVTDRISVDGESIAEATPQEEYYEATSTVEARVTKYKKCHPEPENPMIATDTMELEVTTTFGEADANPAAEIDAIHSVPIGENKYNRGSRIAGLPSDFRNYAGGGKKVTASLLGADISPHAHASWVESAVPNRIESVADVTAGIDAELNVQKRVTLDHEKFLDAKLAAAIASDLAEMQRDAAAITHEYSRTDLLKRGEQSPFTRLIEKTETTLSEQYLDRTKPYDSVGQKAIYEARYAYLQALLAELETVEDGHESAVEGIDDKFEAVDLSLDKALTFLQAGIAAKEPDPVPLDSSNLTGTISYEVTGAPTYLVAANLTKRDVPAIEANTTFTPLAMRNEELFDSPLDDIVDGTVGAVLNAINLGGPDATVPIKTAGDILMAGNLAEAAGDNPITNRSFERSLDAFEDSVSESVKTVSETVAEDTVRQLYPTEAAACVVGENTRGRRVACSSQYSESLLETIRTAHAKIKRSTDTALDSYDTTAQRAVAIGNGTATERIVTTVTQTIDSDAYRHPAFTESYDDGQWRLLVESALRPAIENASAIEVDVGKNKNVEIIEETVKSKIGDVASEAIKKRLGDVAKKASKRVSDKMEQWAGSWSKKAKRPARIAAGLPLLPVPTHWYATMNAWDVTVAGEYARFEVTANVGSPTETTATTYVRENRTVTADIAGESRRLGSVEPINFTGRSVLIVITPTGVGVGDTDGENPECSPTYPEVGVVDPEAMSCARFGLGGG
ncbi:Surface protein [Halorhabdus sp. SVX81]|uniref:DUF7286 family protein n=1 Tax=Halorhabdus sp. SVX81 TaxID=2978283 RepID=UPI0023DB4546|nr:hypothetical protein [Halorhabdus sp. SVX81]WEL17712.1 Surface protein [Halorhabdus sp. SVX81]